MVSGEDALNNTYKNSLILKILAIISSVIIPISITYFIYIMEKFVRFPTIPIPAQNGEVVMVPVSTIINLFAAIILIERIIRIAFWHFSRLIPDNKILNKIESKIASEEAILNAGINFSKIIRKNK